MRLNKLQISEESWRKITTSSVSSLSLTHLKYCTFFSKRIFFCLLFHILLVAFTGVPGPKGVPNKCSLNEWMDEWNPGNTPFFSSFLRSLSLLSARRCGPWHCHRQGEGQRSRHRWKCTVVLWHHRWRRHSTLWNHLWRPGWHHQTKEGKLRKICSHSKHLSGTWVLKFGGVGWTSWHNLRADRGVAYLVVKK